jgi:putative FmdB family regulatory protein
MPIYLYECENCGGRFEAKQSFSDVPLKICPICEGRVHRVIQPASVVFKGSGFYVTDSRGKQNLATSGVKKDESKVEEKTGDGATSGSNGSGDTKKPEPAAKPEPSSKPAE